MAILLVIAALGILTGFLSGLLGISGGILTAPLLLYVPPLIGLEPLSMRTVAGLTIVQGLAACVSGTLTQADLDLSGLPLVTHAQIQELEVVDHAGLLAFMAFETIQQSRDSIPQRRVRGLTALGVG